MAVDTVDAAMSGLARLISNDNSNRIIIILTLSEPVASTGMRPG